MNLFFFFFKLGRTEEISLVKTIIFLTDVDSFQFKMLPR